MSIVPRRRAATSAPSLAISPVERRSTRPSIGRRALSRVIEGPHPWGELDVWPSRSGYTSFCLVVYPPGATRIERIRFRAMRAWPPLGMLLGLTAMGAASHVLPLTVAIVIGCAVYGGGALGLARLAGPSRRRIRTLRTCRGDEGTSAIDRGPQQAMDDLSTLLLTAESEHRAGRIDAVGLELVWTEVWRLLGARRLRQD